MYEVFFSHSFVLLFDLFPSNLSIFDIFLKMTIEGIHSETLIEYNEQINSIYKYIFKLLTRMPTKVVPNLSGKMQKH